MKLISKQEHVTNGVVIEEQRCDADYVGFMSRLLHQRVEEPKQSTISNHVKDEHGKDPKTMTSNFKTLKKCQSKLDCLIFEMLFICELKPKLNKQSDSIFAKLYVFISLLINYMKKLLNSDWLRKECSSSVK